MLTQFFFFFFLLALHGTLSVRLQMLGLDSISAVFLKGRLSEVFGRAPVLDAQMATVSDLVRALEPSEVSPELPDGSRSLSARHANEGDWQDLREMWMNHHHLIEMVDETSRFVLLGPPCWAALLTGLLGIWTWMVLNENMPLKSALAFVVLGILQHFLHWITARCILAYDLRYGELTAPGWRAKGAKGKASAVLVVEAEASKSGSAKLLGVLCLRISPRRGCCRRSKHPMVASLWHATVLPEARNAGVAAALLRGAEAWAVQAGAQRLEAVCLNPAAKAACWNMALELKNPKTGKWPLIPAFFSKTLRVENEGSYRYGVAEMRVMLTHPKTHSITGWR